MEKLSTTPLLTTDRDESNNKVIVVFITLLLLALVFGIWLLYTDWILSERFPEKTDANYYSQRGQYGDMFGAINALFTGLAFAGLIITIILQSQELKLQRKELGQTRAEFKQQNNTLILQRFENTFFNLISLHHQIVGAIDFTYYSEKRMLDQLSARTAFSMVTAGPEFQPLSPELENITIIGRDVFKYLYEAKGELKDKLKNVSRPEDVITIYLPAFMKIQTDFKHYFRNLYRIFKLVDETDFSFGNTDINEDEVKAIQYKYTSIMRAQLSPYELLWLFYNTLARVHSKFPDKNFYDLIVRYTLFRGFPFNQLASGAHRNWYDARAYKLPHEANTESIDPFDQEIIEGNNV
jgi:hypothetical protein